MPPRAAQVLRFAMRERAAFLAALHAAHAAWALRACRGDAAAAAAAAVRGCGAGSAQP